MKISFIGCVVAVFKLGVFAFGFAGFFTEFLFVFIGKTAQMGKAPLVGQL